MPELINTYPEMNDQIAGILRLSGEPPDMYAAQYIEELQAEIERLRASEINLATGCNNLLAILDGTARDYAAQQTIIASCRAMIRAAVGKAE